jgi:UDP:flavonoid glycosyltransferase YjiC (YdhE family)
MRVLFTSTPGFGHLQPMLPLARALEAAGDEVAVAIAPELCGRVESAGLTALPAGDDMAAWWPELSRRHPTEPWNQLAPGRILEWFMPHLFGEVGAAAMLRDLMPQVRSWRPDLIVHETFELAGPIAAAASDVPSIHHTVSPLPSAEATRLTADAVAPLWRTIGLEPHPSAGVAGHLCLDICPPSLRNPEADPGTAVQPLRPVSAAAVGDEVLPASVLALPDRPTVHVTLGTSMTAADQGVLATIIEGLRDEPVNLVVTVGPGHDPEAFGPQPPNVCIERYVPHALLLPRCALVVSHGGAGTMFAALGHGLPLLTVPQGADQYLNAEICARRGVGRTLLTADVTAGSASREVLAVLGDARYRGAAGRVRSEIERMPSPEDVVEILHRA